VIRGEALSIEYRDSGKSEAFPVYPGMTGWDMPEPNVHRGINTGSMPYEEVIVFFLDQPDVEPQPESA
jgi:hypothetical protein